MPVWGLPAAFAVVAFALGFIFHERRRRLSFYDETPIGQSAAQFGRQQHRRRLYRKTLWAVIDALAAACFGWLIATVYFLK